ncbi:MAG: acetolactate synthase large subunit [Actinomycetota bacterium]|nr:acetolactate synthase large subunit [Actinomycetota bacterium]
MNGAHALIQTLVDAGVDVCFANPGTSEMHFVAALDDVPAMRAVLALFEGVATGAADGYARMAGRPAATLLHLGPGLANGIANLHNARRARTPLVNIVGDHATHHKRLDAPLESDIDALASVVSGWFRRSLTTSDLAADAAAAVAAARSAPGCVATLVLPADVSWGEGGRPAAPQRHRAPAPVRASVVTEVAGALAGDEPCVLFLGGSALTERGLLAAARVSTATGARLLCETFPARLPRGAGLPFVRPLAYPPEPALAELAGTRHLVLAGAREPVAFFAYPGLPGSLVPDGCEVHPLAVPGEDATEALCALADDLTGRVSPRMSPEVSTARRPDLPTGPLTPRTLADAIGALMPSGAIVVDEALTSGAHLAAATAGCPRHDWLTLTGGAIGQGLPVATGAAVACPDRPVIAVQADGSAMYTITALWTQAREQLDVTTVICDNRAYAILDGELARVGAARDGERARRLLDLTGPALDFVALATGMGVPARRARSAEELVDHLRWALAEPGPHLIDAVLHPGRAPRPRD